MKDEGGRMADNEEHIRIERKLDTVILLLTGNGNPEHGIVVRLDRLEQWRAGVNKILAPVFLVLVGQFLLFVIGLLINKIELHFP